jgi:ATP-dependent Clp protease adapter protein ClpS
MSEMETVTVVKEEGGVAAPARKKRRRVKPSGKPETKRQPPHSVVLHNDPINRFEWVVGIVRKTFGYGSGRAFLITLRAHCLGRSVAWVGSLEVAEFKAQQLVGFGPDPVKVAVGAKPLKVTVEPVG